MHSFFPRAEVPLKGHEYGRLIVSGKCWHCLQRPKTATDVNGKHTKAGSLKSLALDGLTM